MTSDDADVLRIADIAEHAVFPIWCFLLMPLILDNRQCCLGFPHTQPLPADETSLPSLVPLVSSKLYNRLCGIEVWGGGRKMLDRAM